MTSLSLQGRQLSRRTCAADSAYLSDSGLKSSWTGPSLRIHQADKRAAYQRLTELHFRNSVVGVQNGTIDYSFNQG
jgi:hypothetical protein